MAAIGKLTWEKNSIFKVVEAAGAQFDRAVRSGGDAMCTNATPTTPPSTAEAFHSTSLASRTHFRHADATDGERSACQTQGASAHSAAGCLVPCLTA